MVNLVLNNLRSPSGKILHMSFHLKSLKLNFNGLTALTLSRTTKKSLECMAIIKKHSKDFGGTLEDPDVMKLCGCSRNSYYKYKKEAKSN